MQTLRSAHIHYVLQFPLLYVCRPRFMPLLFPFSSTPPHYSRYIAKPICVPYIPPHTTFMPVPGISNPMPHFLCHQFLRSNSLLFCFALSSSHSLLGAVECSCRGCCIHLLALSRSFSTSFRLKFYSCFCWLLAELYVCRQSINTLRRITSAAPYV